VLRTAGGVRAGEQDTREKRTTAEQDKDRFGQELSDLKSRRGAAEQEIVALTAAPRSVACRALHGSGSRDRFGVTLSTQEAVENLKVQIRSERGAKEQERRASTPSCLAFKQRSASWTPRWRIDEALLALSERLESRLVAERFDDVAEADAAEVEAVLGLCTGRFSSTTSSVPRNACPASTNGPIPCGSSPQTASPKRRRGPRFGTRSWFRPGKRGG